MHFLISTKANIERETMRNLRIITSHFSRGFKSIETNPFSNSFISIQSRSYSENVSGAGKVGEKTEFDLIFRSYDKASSSWMKVVKEVRLVTDIGYEEAKELVEKAPTFLKKGVTKEEAEMVIEKLKAVGAKVSMN